MRRQLPEAQITFDVEPEAAVALKRDLLIGDEWARNEWGWAGAYDLDAMITDTIAELAKG